MTLPKGWSEVALSELGRWGSGGTPKSSERVYYGGDVPWIRSGDLPGGPILRHEVNISASGLENSSTKWVNAGALLIAMYGATIGKLGVTTYPVTTNQAVAFLEPYEGVDVRYLFENLRFRNNELVALGQGGAQPNISQEILKAQRLPLPPYAEQRRIVAKLNALTTRITQARNALDRVPMLSRRLRTEVLNGAFSQANTSRELRSLSEFVTSGSRGWAKYYSEDGPIFIRVGDVRRGDLSLDLKSVQRVHPPEGAEGARTAVRPGDLVVTITADLGRVGIIPDDLGSAFVNQHVALVRLSDTDLARWIGWFLISDEGQRQLLAKDRGVTKAGLGLRDIGDVRVPIASPRFRENLVKMIDVAFSRADHLDAEEAHARALLDRLESAILAKAFRGELVPQDPSDEPASVLLARIREERAAQPKGLRKRNSSKDKAMTQPPLSPRDRLLKDSERWPKSGVPFAEVAQRVSLPHDEMRDTLFALMRGPTPILRQTFDEKRELMLIQRNAA